MLGRLTIATGILLVSACTSTGAQKGEVAAADATPTVTASASSTASAGAGEPTMDPQLPAAPTPATGTAGQPTVPTTVATGQPTTPTTPTTVATGQPTTHTTVTAGQPTVPTTVATGQPPAPTTVATGQPASATTVATGQPTTMPPVQTTVATGQPTPTTGGDPNTYVPQTAHDNTPWRFNMQQDGRSMSADEFDAWMRQRGVRVATGKPAVPLVQNCPTPEGDKGDSDGDGVINCLDKCPASEAGQTIGPDGCPVPVSIDLKGVTFAYDKATLGAEAKAVLAEALEILQRHPALKVQVAGHTDSRGDASYNQALSERRAKAVYDFLVSSGIDKARLIGPVGFGESRPIVPNQRPDGSDDPEGRAKNRRTELNIHT